jgi:Protein of unknown function (DUF2946)
MARLPFSYTLQMSFGHSLKALIAWIASVAILMSALAPAMAQTLRHDVSASWTEICSVTGMQWVKVDGSRQTGTDKSGSTDEGGSTHGLKQCPYCSTHSPVLGLPPTVSTVLPIKPRAAYCPALFLTAPRTLFAWAAAQPRAPPFQA